LGSIKSDKKLLKTSVISMLKSTSDVRMIQVMDHPNKFLVSFSVTLGAKLVG
jgi:hypothetical protein